MEAPNLFAADAADRLMVDTIGEAITEPGLVVIGDNYGALTLAAAHRGNHNIRVHQDLVTSEEALTANATRLGLTGTYISSGLDLDLVRNASAILLRLPRSLDALKEIGELIATHAPASVTVYAGGMVKHMTPAMKTTLSSFFDTVDSSLAQHKARVLIAQHPRVLQPTTWPRRTFDAGAGMWICAHGGVFSGTTVDIGTRFLLSTLVNAVPHAQNAIDLGCGSGVLATSLALKRSEIRVIASDQSAAACASTRATSLANGVADRISVFRDNGLSQQPSGSADLIALNPPFHIGNAVHTGIALRLIRDAGRVIAPGGEVWTVWNSHLRYRGALGRLIGPTRQIARNSLFTITASIRRSND